MTHLRTQNSNYLYTQNPFATLETVFNDPFFLGFGDQFHRWTTNKTTSSSFPPYNVKKIDDDTYVVELAVAGYDREDLDITVDKDTLIIKSDRENEDKSEFFYRGIAGRKFTQTFTLGEYMIVKSASLENGILTVKIEREVPEEAKPKTIRIK